MYDTVQDDARIVALDVPSVLDAAREAHGRLLALHDQCDSWTPKEWDKAKLNAEEDMRTFQKSFQTLLDYKSSIQIACDDRKSSNVVTKRRAGAQRVALCKLLAPETWPCPKGLARHIAQNIVDLKPEELYVARVFSSASSCADDPPGYFTIDKTTQPGLILEKSVLGDKDFWFHAIALSTDKLESEVKDKSKKMDAAFAQDTDVVKWGFVTALSKTTFVVNETTMGVLDLHSDALPIMTGQRKFRFCAEAVGNPYAGVGGVLTVLKGHACTTVLSVDTLLSQNKGLYDIKAFLENIDAAWLLQNAISFNMPCTCSIWIPFGFVPIVVGLHESASSEDTDGQLATLFTPLFDKLGVISATPAVRLEIKSWLDRGITTNVKALQGNANFLKSWFDTWPTADTLKSIDELDVD